MPRAGRRYDHVVDKSSLSLRIASVSLDCGDHEEPARFYADLLQGTLLWIHEKSAAIESDGMVLVMQRIEDYRPPTWPGTSIVHLDLHGVPRSASLSGAPLHWVPGLHRRSRTRDGEYCSIRLAIPFALPPSPRK
jgi:hypothetical protein